MLATAMLRRPSASLPAQVASPAALKAAYRLLASEDVSFAALARPHWDVTRTHARHADLVLLVQDTTELDYAQHPTTTGLGPIGNTNGQGILLHSTLAVLPQPRTILGLAAQEPFLRQASPQPKGSGAATRRARARESQVWERAISAIGPPPPERCWIHVGDRYADIFDWMELCQQQGCQFLVRATQNRQVQTEDAHLSHVMTVAQHLCPRDLQEMDLAARPRRPARRARVAIGWPPVQLQSPAHSRQKVPLPVWVIRVWEPDPPTDVEAVEWVLLTSVPTTTVAEAWERRDW